MLEKTHSVLELEIARFEECQKSIIRRIVGSLARGSEVIGLMIGGSVAKRNQDNYSDFDLIVVVENADHVEQQLEGVLNVARSIHSFIDFSVSRNLKYFGDLISLFFDNFAFSVDVGVFSSQKLKTTRLEPYGIILCDRSGVLSRALASEWSSHLSRPYTEEIWISLLKAYKALGRQNLWRAHEYLSRSRRATLAVIMTQLGIDIQYEDRPDHKIESIFDTIIFNKTWPSNDDASFVRCAIAILEIAQTCKLTCRQRRLMNLVKEKFETRLSRYG